MIKEMRTEKKIFNKINQIMLIIIFIMMIGMSSTVHATSNLLEYGREFYYGQSIHLTNVEKTADITDNTEVKSILNAIVTGKKKYIDDNGLNRNFDLVEEQNNFFANMVYDQSLDKIDYTIVYSDETTDGELFIDCATGKCWYYYALNGHGGANIKKYTYMTLSSNQLNTLKNIFVSENQEKKQVSTNTAVVASKKEASNQNVKTNIKTTTDTNIKVSTSVKTTTNLNDYNKEDEKNESRLKDNVTDTVNTLIYVNITLVCIIVVLVIIFIVLLVKYMKKK